MTSRWHEVMRAVPRRRFIPDMIWQNSGGRLVPASRAEDPDAWLGLVESDRFVITQVDDGHPAGPGLEGRQITSSASMPELVTKMLDALDVREGQRVLEIGTGTGWNAALLAHVLGADRVTSIEVDPDLTLHARKALSDNGYGGVRVLNRDGALGFRPGAPYDRVIATVAPRRIPPAWIAQTRPGGRIVTPWDTDYLGVLLALDMREDGTARGRVFDHAAFMLLRNQRPTRTGFHTTPEQEDQAAVSEASIHLAEVANPYYALGAMVAITAQVRHCVMEYFPPDDRGDAVLWLADYDSESWARLHDDPRSEGPYPVVQFGPRRLWDEVAAAHRWWVEQDRPGPDCWEITVSAEAHRFEFTG